jgi:uncharacterized membrane protein
MRHFLSFSDDHKPHIDNETTGNTPRKSARFMPRTTGMTENVFTSTTRNVSEPERWVSVVLGSAVAAYGLKMRSIPGLVLAGIGGALVWRGASGHCLVYESLGLTTAEEDDADTRHVSVPYGKGIRVEESVNIQASPEQIYAFWRKLDNLPRFMNHLETVEVRDAKHSHWVAKGPAGTRVDWEAEIINEIPNELIGWRSLEGSDVDNAGSVHFTPSASGTDVRVILRYDPPAGAAGARIAKMLGEDPAENVREDLRRLKAILESGQVGGIRAV